MVCPVCDRRAARRACPALKQTICPVCCGTKRQREIACPADCPHLVAAQAHPAAVVRRQQEDDIRMFIPTVRDLNQRQEEVMSNVLMVLRGHRGDPLVPTTDDDVQAAAAALAATYETAARGLIYEERPASLPAQRLVADLQAWLAELLRDGTLPHGDVAVVFRAVERGARDARKTLAGGTSAYLKLLTRLIAATPADGGEGMPAERRPGAAPMADQPHGSLIIRP
jgi:hypothetical protein